MHVSIFRLIFCLLFHFHSFFFFLSFFSFFKVGLLRDSVFNFTFTPLDVSKKSCPFQYIVSICNEEEVSGFAFVFPQETDCSPHCKIWFNQTVTNTAEPFTEAMTKSIVIDHGGVYHLVARQCGGGTATYKVSLICLFISSVLLCLFRLFIHIYIHKLLVFF